MGCHVEGMGNEKKKKEGERKRSEKKEM